MRKRAFIFLFLLVLLFTFNFVSSVAPTQTVLNTQSGLNIFTGTPNKISINQTVYVDVHVINNTDNKYLNNSLYNCTFFLHNSSGADQLTINLTNLGSLEEEVIILGNNFTIKGIYSYHIVCFSTPDGDGVIQGDFTVSRTGTELSTAESLLYPILTGIVFFMLLISAWLTYALPYKNKEILETGKIFINTLKYAKLMMILITQALLVWLLNVIMALSDSYASITVFYGFVSFLFNIIIGFSYPLFILVVILIGINFFKDVKAMKLNKMFMRNG